MGGRGSPANSDQQYLFATAAVKLKAGAMPVSISPIRNIEP